ncbi:MAG: PAS domain-containing protein [Flavobacteriales bacterium]
MNEKRYFSLAIKYSGWLLVLASLLVMYGWLRNVTFLKSVLPNMVTMKFNTALCFFLFGLSMVFKGEKYNPITIVFASCTLILSSISLSQDLFKIDLGIDQLFVSDSNSLIAYPGRMAATSAICFILGSIAMGFSCTLQKWIKLLNQLCWHLITLISFLAIVGYSYKVPAFYSLSFLSSMALDSSLLFFIASLTGSLIHSDLGITGLILGDKAGNIVAKKLIPMAVLLIMVLGFFHILSQRYQIVSPEVGIALFSSSFIVIIVIMVAVVAQELNIFDAKRDSAEKALTDLTDSLAITLKEKTIEIKELEASFEYATSKSEIGIAVVDLKTGLIDCNDHYADFIGIHGRNRLTREEARKRLTHPDDLENNLAVFNEALKTGRSYESEMKAIRHDGEVRILRFNGNFKKDKDGVPVKFTYIFRDITEEKKMIQNIQESSDRLEIATSGAGISVWEIDAKNGALKIDAIGEKIFGIQSNNYIESRQQINELIYPEDREKIGKYFTDLVQHNEKFSTTFRIIRTDGAHRVLRSVGMPKDKNAKGNTSFIGIYFDITEQVEIEKKIDQITQTLKIATEGSNIGVWDYDLVNNRLIWDEGMYKLYGIKARDFEGVYEAWIKGVHPDDMPDTHKQVEMAISGEKKFDTEFRVIWPDGSIHFIKGNAIVQRDEQGKALRMIGINWDITPLKESERQLIFNAIELQNKNTELEQFAYVASHDLQEPLRTIRSLIDFVNSHPGVIVNDDVKTSFTYINSAAERMQNLIKDLLEYSKVGKNSELKKADCNTVVHSIAYDLQNIIKDSEAKINVEKLPVIMAYESELRSLFQNLISNAIKYRKPDLAPEINIEAESKGDFWQFAISDNGIGIDPQHREKVFVIFQRLHRNNEYQGTGIGLAQCKKIAALHKGDIWLESEPQKGSTFYFTINKDLHEKN